MIDYKRCDKLIDLLDKGDLKKIKKCIENERNKYYILEARKALPEYLARGHDCRLQYYDYFKFTDCNLLLTNGFSAYFLKTAEILTRGQKLETHDKLHLISCRIMDLYKKYEADQVPVEEITKISAGKKDRKTIINLKTKDGQIHEFYEDEFSFAKAFLGEDVEYGIAAGDYGKVLHPCLVKSKKGTGFIMGKRI